MDPFRLGQSPYDVSRFSNLFCSPDWHRVRDQGRLSGRIARFTPLCDGCAMRGRGRPAAADGAGAPIAATPPLGWLDTTNSLPPGHRYPWRPAIEQPDTGAWMAHASSLPSFDFLDDTSSMPRRHNVPWRPRPQPDDVAVWAHVAAEQSARGSDRA
jgi:hypothetical protein